MGLLEALEQPIAIRFNRLASATCSPDEHLTWEAHGNLISDGVFTYTAAGRMVRAQGLTATLVYMYTSAALSAGTADGLRVAQSVDGDVTTFTWDWASGIPEMLVAIRSTNPDTLSQNVLPSCGVYVEGSTCDEVSGYLANGRWNPYGSDASGMPYCPLGRDPAGLPEALANTVGFYVATDGQGHRTVQIPPVVFEWVEGHYRDSVIGP